MKVSRIVALAVLVLCVVGITFAAVNRRPPVTVLKSPAINPALVVATTGVQGTITVQGSLPTQLKSMTCADIKVFVGKWVTPPPPAGGGIAISTFQESASAAATGAFPTCSYKVTNVPAGEFDVMLNANQEKFACDQTTLNQQPSQAKLTFTKGQMQTKNFTATPNCSIIK